MLQLASLFIALIVGHRLPTFVLRPCTLNHLLTSSVMAALFIMGYDFGSHTTHIGPEVSQLIKEVLSFTLLLFTFNFLATRLFSCSKQALRDGLLHDQEALPHFFSYVVASSQYLLFVVIGAMVGHEIHRDLLYLNSIISVLLFVILIIIGQQLKQQGVSLWNILANKDGFKLSILILISSLLAGMIGAVLLQFDIKIGLMLSSGFGWYTLSGILSNQLVNQHFGTASFCIDFMRELTSLLFIPVLGRKYPMSVIGHAGATSLDFNLPIIKAHVGEAGVPIAVTSGMVLTLLVPLLMPLPWILFN